MGVTVHLPGYLAGLAGGASRVVLPGSPATVSDVLAALWAAQPALRDRVLAEDGTLRPHVNVFVDGESVRYLDGFATPVREQAEIVILPAVSGG